MARIVWKNSLTGQKAQFVADTLNDSLFNYGFDSNKVPSLNLHFSAWITYPHINSWKME